MKIRWPIALFALGIVVAGFFAVKAVLVNEASPTLLHVGILPDQSKDILQDKYAPFLDYLAAETGIDVSLVVPASYLELLELFRDREVDLAYFGGFTYAQAHALYDAVPLVMRDVDTKFMSWFLVRAGDAGDDLVDFRGRKFAFGSRLSTSGHLMPRHFMQTEKQLVPEEFFSEVRYSGTHDATAYLVRDGDVDVGVANAQIIKNMMMDGRLEKDDFRILWQTPPYIDYVWAVHENLEEDLTTRLRDAFLGLNASGQDQGKILESLGAGFFLPAGRGDFLLLEQIARDLGLLDTAIR